VFKQLPWVGVVTIAAVLGITGAPFFIGSISKYFISADVPLVVELSVIVISLGTIISFTKYSGMLFGKPTPLAGDVPVPDKWRLVPSLGLAAFCLLGGVFGQPLVRFLFVTDATIDIMGYIQKALIFFASAIVGFVIYKYIVKGNAFLKKVGALDLGYRSAVVSMGVFFAIIVVFVGVL
jgi:multicomponent Na+:H+ antiporter subunit D